MKNENDIIIAQEILCISFNQDYSCMAAGTEKGFYIFNTNPFKKKFFRDLEGGIGIVRMLNRTNIIALVGGGKRERFPKNQVIIWDDHQNKPLSDLKFNSFVRNVKLRKDKIYVICDTQIYSFTLQGFQSVDIIETYDNRLGVFGICYDPNVTIIAFPDKAKKGKVRIKNMDKNSTNTVDAHENIISFISFNNNGSIMATASDRGTLIRLFLTETGYFFQEIRRGKDKAVIKDICFEPNNKLIACCSDKGTVHIWNLESKLKQVFKDENENNNKEESISSSSKKEDLAQNHKSIFSSLPNFVSGGFFKSEWSFANVRIKDSNSICCFGKEDEIIIISSQGNYYKANIDLKKGGDCEITEKIEYAK